jgi:hypothetical protein
MILKQAIIFLTLLLTLSALSQQKVSRGANPTNRARIGVLGETIQPTSIYLKPDKRSRILWKLDKGVYVVIRNLTNDWATIVMEDGSDAFVPAGDLKQLPYEVNIRPPAPSTASRPLPNWQNVLLTEAMRYLGTRYVWGGNDLTNGVDCSGFTQQLFARVGIYLPRTAEQQSKVGTPVGRLDLLQPGDRLYFCDSDRTRINHTGIYIGNGYFIHSSRSAGGVTIDFLSEKWLKILVDARRF